MPQKITKHFTLEELTTTSQPHDNTPKTPQIINLSRLCCLVLEPLREITGPLNITSGYRSPEVNAAVGGSVNPPSAHTYGRAADVQPAGAQLNALDLMFALQGSLIEFDKAIFEVRTGRPWLHVQIRNVDKKPRQKMFMSLKSGVFEIFDPEDPRLEPYK